MRGGGTARNRVSGKGLPEGGGRYRNELPHLIDWEGGGKQSARSQFVKQKM